MGEITTLLGRGATFDGKLTFEGTVRIDGRFKGEVFSEDVLVIGEGQLRGDFINHELTQEQVLAAALSQAGSHNNNDRKSA